MSFADREDEVFHFSVISDPLFSDKPNETSEIGDNFFLNVRVYFQPHSMPTYLLASEKEVFTIILDLQFTF